MVLFALALTNGVRLIWEEYVRRWLGRFQHVESCSLNALGCIVLISEVDKEIDQGRTLVRLGVVTSYQLWQGAVQNEVKPLCYGGFLFPNGSFDYQSLNSFFGPR